ncbi:MAG: GH3 auxin-responsive promoter family protein [Planctomycetes bacterium]|nr:GH3 auxin-responsive promoter family protein [Planctomycetota bacterium]
MNVAGPIAAAVARRRLATMRRLARDPRRAQDALLARIAARMANTKFGRLHGLAGVRRVEDLANALPLHDHSTMATWWNRARSGEPDVCWPGIVRHWAISSGTTSGEKFLPVPDSTIRSNQGGGFDALAPHLARQGGGIFGGKLLFLGGCTAMRNDGPAVIGDNTGIMALHVPRLLRRWHAPAPEIRAIPDWEEKVRRAAATTIDQDLRMVAGVPSWIVLWGEEVLAAVRQRGGQATTLRHVWPHLSLYVHGGVAFAPYRTRVRELFGDGVEFVDTYSASEGGMLAVQDTPDSGGMLPLVDRGAVFEFVPRDELGAASPRRTPLALVEPGVEYAVAVTTDAGMASYVLGDTVRFVGCDPLRLEFAGRIAHTLNAFGEHVSGGELDRAVASAAASCDASVDEFAVTTEFPEPGEPKGRHVFLVEFRREPHDLDAFARAIDGALATGNEDYATHRTHGLRPPLVAKLPSGSFLAWMRERGKVGGQNKVPRVLTPDAAAALRGPAAVVAPQRIFS